MDQFAAGRRGVLGQVVLFAEEYLEATPGGVGSDAHAIDAAADHGEVIAVSDGGWDETGWDTGKASWGCSHRI